MKQDKFSIQDWKSNHFYNLIEESNEVMENANLEEAASLESLFPNVDKGDMDNDFFVNLFDALADYFVEHAEELTNMDAKKIAHHCIQASIAIRERTSN